MQYNNSSNLREEISALPCFQCTENNSVFSINRIKKGQSSVCFEVKFKQNRFFVKHLKLNAGVNAELTASKRAAEIQVSPDVTFSSDEWLVCEFIEGISLNELAFSIDKYINLSIKLMVQCHAIAIEIPVFDVFHTIRQLSLANQFTGIQTELVERATNQIERLKVKELLFCHGDLNFSNVLVGDKSWLLDFECACLAEAEFDVAMFIAINTLNESDQTHTVKCYEQSCDKVLDKSKLMSYLQCSYLLNGLWYLDKSRSEPFFRNHQGYNECDLELFEALGLKQFELFDRISPLVDNLIDVMR